MSDTFDINDRQTWDWVSREVTAAPGDSYLIDPESRGHFYEVSNGVPYRQACPEGLVFDPRVTPGPVCVWPRDGSEADVYDWAVSKGLVNDQR